MLSKIKNSLVVALALTFLAVPVLVPAAVSAQDDPEIQGPLCAGVELDFNTNSTDCAKTAGSDAKVSGLIKTIINILSVVVGVIAVIMIIFGGLKYITSGGESNNISSAKNTIIFAIVGLVIVALAQFIVRFVLDRAINGAANNP
jgi:cytochrome bd-type quinol oxidase subunit 2